jgi:putative transposase
MSRKGNCIDNASTESFFGHMKDELDISHCRTFREVQIVVSAYMSYHNLERRQWNKQKMTPIAYRDHLLELSIR